MFFALENPALFHLMFGGQLSELIDVDCLQQSFGPSYQLLVDAIHRQPLTSQYDATPELADIAHAWALVHGLASLLQAKTFAPRMYGYDTVDAFATDMLRKFLGFRAAPPRLSRWGCACHSRICGFTQALARAPQAPADIPAARRNTARSPSSAGPVRRPRELWCRRRCASG